ncbi:hypothetical protein [Neisseria iguanae]|nr:hypothetical protein [Neisseria iguanae]
MGHREVWRLSVGKSIGKNIDMMGERPSESMWQKFTKRANTV